MYLFNIKMNRLHRVWMVTCYLIISAIPLFAQEPAEDTNTHVTGNEFFSRQDSLHRQQILDSIRERDLFVRDSLLVREQFIRDSIAHRQKVLDSLHQVKDQLQILLEAGIKATKEDIILRCEPIVIKGDSTLADFIYTTLPFGVKDPYCPWRKAVSLSPDRIKLRMDGKRAIISVHTTQLKSTFSKVAGSNMIIVQQPALIQNNSSGHFYKIPVDTVFYDHLGRIAKIKSYVQFYSVMGSNGKGNFLFTNRTVVKQYEYGYQGQMLRYQLVRFCERWKSYASNEVCSILTYDIDQQGKTYRLTRSNDPANKYSDGIYTFLFDDTDNLTSISFSNQAGTENWQRLIEMNKDGNVSCYIDKTNDIIRQSLCMIYHSEPQARFPVEIITTTFEKDGISYLQKNITTGKMRTRDRMTLEWTRWQ